MKRNQCTATVICNVNVRNIKNYMHSIALDHMDSGGEINLTTLAEDAANQFDLYTGDKIPEDVFELSYNVVQMFN